MFSQFLSYSCMFAAAVYAQSSSPSSSSSSSGSILTLSGLSEAATPTGPYISYASTVTLSSSAITTSPLLSTVTSGSTTRTTTLGSTTIFGIGNLAANFSSTSTSTSTNSQIILSGRPSSSTLSGNSTANATSSAVPTATNTTPCNNYPEFCSRRYGNITEIGAHNSPFIKSGNAASNQALPVTTQLNDGVRLLQGQMHFVGSVPHFCHTSCDVLDAGPITTYLGEVYDWVISHPYDVITILLGNGNYNQVTTYAPFIEQTNLNQFAYIPPKIPMAITDWPVLSDFILSGKRVVFFMDYWANQSEVPWILDEFSQMWETPFDPTDRAFPCTAQRPPNLSPADATDRLYLFNHNLNYDINILGNSLLVPSIPLLNVTNSNSTTEFGSLGMNAQSCNDTWHYPPKFLNVDFYNEGSTNGSVFEVAAKFNNVTWNGRCCGTTGTNGATSLTEAIGRATWLVAIAVVGFTWLLSE